MESSKILELLNQIIPQVKQKENSEVLLKAVSDTITHLKKIDPKTKLPGNLISKDEKTVGVHAKHPAKLAGPGVSRAGASASLAADIKSGKESVAPTIDKKKLTSNLIGASKKLHNNVLSELKQMPKPNLPKSENMMKDDAPHPAGSPEATAHEVAEHKLTPTEGAHKLGDIHKVHAMFNHLRQKNKLGNNWHRSPENIKSDSPAIQGNLSHEDEVAGVPFPHHLKRHTGRLPENHPDRGDMVKWIQQVNAKSPHDATRMSGKYLNVGDLAEKPRYADVQDDKLKASENMKKGVKIPGGTMNAPALIRVGNGNGKTGGFGAQMPKPQSSMVAVKNEEMSKADLSQDAVKRAALSKCFKKMHDLHKACKGKSLPEKSK